MLSNKAVNGDKDAIKSLELLRISIKARIEDYDNFFKQNFSDYRISYFEKQKFRLRKVLHEANEGELYGEEGGVVKELEMKYVLNGTKNNFTKSNRFAGTGKTGKSKTPVKKKKLGLKSGKDTGGLSTMKATKSTGIGKKKVNLKSKRGY